MSKAEVSIVVPTLGSKLNLQKLIDSISKQEIFLASIDLVVVVNGLSNESFMKLKEEISTSININWSYIDVANVNAARNKGLDLALCDLVYFLDDDCELVNKDTLNFHITSHNKDSDLFALGGGYSLPASSTYWDVLYNSIQMSWLLSGKNAGTSKTQHLLGGNFSLKRNLLNEKNLKFDERISYGGSEHQLFVEAVQKKLKIQLCNIEVRHNTSENFNKICTKIFRQGRGKAIIDGKSNLDIENKSVKKNSFMSSSDGSFQLSTLKDSVFKKILNYIFWYGYYKQNQRPGLLFVKVVKDFFNYLNYLRFKIIDKFK